jgi:hypothetical protein
VASAFGWGPIGSASLVADFGPAPLRRTLPQPYCITIFLSLSREFSVLDHSEISSPRLQSIVAMAQGRDLTDSVLVEQNAVGYRG